MTDDRDHVGPSHALLALLGAICWVQRAERMLTIERRDAGSLGADDPLVLAALGVAALGRRGEGRLLAFAGLLEQSVESPPAIPGHERLLR